MSNKAGKRGRVPERRFPEFRDAEEWQSAQLDDLISTVTPPKKIPTTDYLSEGQFPIIDQGQSDIAGWTNDPDAIVEASQPLIVFGDHTCALKLISRSFAQGADGIKIIKGSGLADTAFLYQFLCFRPVVSEEYKRHFSILKTKIVTYPNRKSGEQQKIADCLASLDELITLEAQKLNTLKTHKKGLMQQLFPAEGETLPKLRFPEFRESGDWSKEKLGAVAILYKGKGVSKAEIVANGVQPCIRYGELYTIYGETIHEIASSTNVDASELFLSKKNDVIIPASGETKIDIAKASCVMSDDIALGGDLNVIRSSQNGIFLSYQLNGPLRLSIAKVAQGDTVVHLYPTQIQQLDVLVPSPIEQQKVADCLASLDNLITAQTQKLAALKTHKKGLLQQLFPALDEVPA